MGNPSEGKQLTPNKLCEQCGCILIGEDEEYVGACVDCQEEIATEIAQTTGQEHLLIGVKHEGN